MTLQATVSISWVNTVIASAERLGVSAEHLLAVAGIGLGALNQERWPIDDITRLWRAAERCTGDRGFGLKTGSLVGPASLNVVSFLLQSSATLREALNHLQKYQRLISDGGRFQLLSGEQASWIVYHPRQGELAFSPHQIEAVLAAVVSFTRWITASSVPPLLAQCSHSQLGESADYQSVFACPLLFEQAFSGLLLSNTVLDQALPQADAQLAQLHERYAAVQLGSLSETATALPQLRLWLQSQLNGSVPTRASTAKALNLSERTLSRRLKAQGSSFEQVLDEVRQSAALNAVGHTTRGLSDIAQSLGFAESSTFYRAFRRWTGDTPARWRKRSQQSA